MDAIIRALQRYTIQSGALTTVLAFVSAICVSYIIYVALATYSDNCLYESQGLVMPHNLIWIGTHFVISKLYTVSLVASYVISRRCHERLLLYYNINAG